MYQRNDANFSRFGQEISESADFIDQSVEDHSPIHGLRSPINSYKSRQLFCIEQQELEDISIDNDINSFNNPYTLFKCYRCYGVRNHSSLGYSLPLCEQCQGSEYISQANPLVSLLERVLKKKLPLLSKRQERNHILNNSHFLFCSGCAKENQKQHCFSCQQCRNYYLCSKCLENSSFFHPKWHRFNKVINEHPAKIKETLINMKKISEEYEKEQNYNNEDQTKCSICSELIEGCYFACQNCQQQAEPFNACSKCEETQQYTHDSSHDIALRTITMQSKLLELFSKPSANSSTCTNLKETQQQSQNAHSPHSPQINRELTTYARSMVFFPQLDLDDSNQMPEQDQNQQIRTSETEIVWSPTFRNTSSENFIKQEITYNPQSCGALHGSKNCMDQKQARSLVLCSGSMVDIKIQESDDHFRDFVQPRYFNPNTDIPIMVPLAISSSSKDHTELLTRPNEVNDDFIFKDYQCDICLTQPIKNIRYHCKQCDNYDLCLVCYQTRAKQHEHLNFQEIDGRAVKRDRQIRLSRLRESSARQACVPLPKSTLSFSLIRSLAN